MKLSIILLIAFFAIALCGRTNEMIRLKRSYQQECSSFRCEKSGETCGLIELNSYNTITTSCINADTEYCNITQVGNGIQQGTCITYATAGQSCSNRQCTLGYQCLASVLNPNPVCTAVEVEPIVRKPGEKCGSANVQCQFDNGLTTENTCSGGICKFTPDGQTCSPGLSQCNVNSVCLSSSGFSYTCQARFAEGSSCITNSSLPNNMCARDLNCIPNQVDSNSGVCSKPFSQKEKGACQDISDCKDGVCSDPDGASDTVLYGVCTKYRKTSTLNERCASDSDCTSSNGEQCVCVDDEKSVCKNTYFQRKYQKQYENYVECTSEFEEQCGGLEERAQTKCYLDNCKKTACDYYKASKKEGYQTDDCLVIQVCDASTLFASFPILIAIAVIVMLFQ